jgi:hypothetical protein
MFDVMVVPDAFDGCDAVLAGDENRADVIEPNNDCDVVIGADNVIDGVLDVTWALNDVIVVGKLLLLF